MESEGLVTDVIGQVLQTVEITSVTPEDVSSQFDFLAKKLLAQETITSLDLNSLNNLLYSHFDLAKHEPFFSSIIVKLFSFLPSPSDHDDNLLANIFYTIGVIQGCDYAFNDQILSLHNGLSLILRYSKIEHPFVQEQALYVLTNLCNKKETCEQIFSNKEVFETIVQAIDSVYCEVQKQALSAIGTAIINLAAKDIFNSIIDRIVEMFTNSTTDYDEGSVSSRLTWLLSTCVSHSESIRIHLSNSNFVSLLITHLKSAADSEKAKAIVTCLGTIAQENTENQLLVATKETLTYFMSLLDSSNVQLQQSTIQTIAYCIIGNGTCVFKMEINFQDENYSHVNSLGFVKKLVKFLFVSNSSLNLVCLSALSYVTQTSDAKVGLDILLYGGLPQLIHMLHSDIELMQLFSCKILGAIIPSKTIIQDELRRLGFISAIVQILSSSTNDDILREAMTAISYLAAHAGSREEIRLVGGLPFIVHLLTSKDEVILKQSLIAILNCSAHNNENKTEIRELDGLQLIFSLLSHDSIQVVLLALGALSNLSLDAENRVAVRQLDGLRILLNMITSENHEVQAMSIRTLSWLCYNDEANQNQIRDLKGIQKLVELLSVDNPYLISQAARCLGALAADNKDNKNLISIMGGFKLLKVLESSEDQNIANQAGFAMAILTEGVGLEIAEIDMLPSFAYEPKEEENEEQSVCSICLGEFLHGQELRMLPCFHRFHIDCIDMWLSCSALCPNCKFDLCSELRNVRKEEE